MIENATGSIWTINASAKAGGSLNAQLTAAAGGDLVFSGNITARAFRSDERGDQAFGLEVDRILLDRR